MHPDTISGKLSRKQQIEILALSLIEIKDKLQDIEMVCIEPRGGDRQNKVLRAEIGDIITLNNCLKSNTTKGIGLCMDLAQLFIVHGNKGIVHFLDELKTS